MYIYSQYYQKEIFSTKIDNFETALKENLINEIFEEFDTNIDNYLVDDHISMDTKENLDSLYSLYYNFEKELAQKPMYLFHLKNDFVYIDLTVSKQENNHYFAEIIIDKPYEDYWTAKIEWFD
jgi:hypothetical protein